MILYLRQSKLFEVEKKQQRMIEEMEDVISTYLAEMKEENESFIERMTKAANNQSNNKENKKKEVRIEPILPSAEDEKLQFPVKNSKSHAVKAYKLGATQSLTDEDVEILLPDFTEAEDSSVDLKVENQVEDTVQEGLSDPKERSLLEEVLHLQEQGLTYEEIAKKLHKGQTEIELLLKFRQKILE